MVLGGIVVAFLLMFFSLAQEQEIRSDLDRLGQEPAIRKLSIDAGLTQLGEPLVLPGR